MRSIRRFMGCVRVAALTATAAGLSGSGTTLFAAGQSQTPPAPVQPVTPAQPEGPTLRLTVEEAVTMALEHNLGLQADRLDPQIQNYNVQFARGAFTPVFFSSLQNTSSESPSASFLAGAAETITDDRFSSSLGVQQNVPWGGGSYALTWSGARLETTGFTSFNPQLSSGLQGEFVQPLLRNFQIDSLRQQVLLNTKQREIADVGLRQSIAQTGRLARNAYWDLVFTIAQHRVQVQSLELARESLRNNRTRVEVGTMAPIDIVEAEAEVARNEEAVIVAEANIRSVEDRLRALILDPSSPDFWAVRLEPTQQPVLGAPQAINVDAAIQNALQNRTDILQTRKELETAEINVRFYSNQRLPDINLEGSYRAAGLGGTQLEFGQGGFPPPVIGQTERSFGSVLGDVFGFDFPTWTVGVSFGYPIGRSQADAGLARARIQNQQARTFLQNLELQVSTVVRDMGRQVNTNLKRVQATQVARQLAERRLEAEQKKFNVGMSTTFLVFQAQRELAGARTNELRAVIDYNQSLVDFEAIQQIPLTASTGSVSVGSTATTSLSATGAALR
jgi:outer membrane protein TolC